MATIDGELSGEMGGTGGGSGMQGGAVGPGVVSEEIPCRKCGYNLRGLSPEGLCPECGTSVWLSLRGTLLRYSDPNWIETLRKGFARMVAGITVVVVTIFGGVVVGMVAAAFGVLEIVILVQLVAVVGWVLYMWGTWLITEPDPSGIGEDLYGTSRKIIRVGVVIQAVGQVLEFAPFDRMAPAAAMLLQIINVVIGIIFLVALFAQLQYLQKLAMRIPDVKLSERSRFLKKAIVTSYATLIASGIGTLLMGGGAGSVVFGILAALAALALLVFALMYVRLLSRMKKSFQEQVAGARAAWSATVAAGAAT